MNPLLPAFFQARGEGGKTNIMDTKDYSAKELTEKSKVCEVEAAGKVCGGCEVCGEYDKYLTRDWQQEVERGIW